MTGKGADLRDTKDREETDLSPTHTDRETEDSESNSSDVPD